MKLTGLFMSTLTVLFVSCFCGYAQSTEELLHTFYLIGDAGEPSLADDSNLDLLEAHLSKEGPNSTLIFLGDNIYPKGLPNQDHPDRKAMEQKLVRQLKVRNEFKGRTFFLHGNHDWEKSKSKGWERGLNQEEFLRTFTENDSIMLPFSGCPGPVEIKISEELTLILLNSQWLFHPWDKPSEEDGCQPGGKLAVLEKLDEILRRNDGKQVLIAQHHPLFTYGVHGGAYSLKDHIFPLTNKNPNLYIPLPVLGSIYPLYRTFLGDKQDATNFEYKVVRNAMHKILARYPNIIHAAGHEHSLQHIQKDSVNYIVSGSGSKSTRVTGGKYSLFKSPVRGFVRLLYYKNGKVEITYFNGEDKNGKTIYQAAFDKRAKSKNEIDEKISEIKESTVKVYASDQYHREGTSLLGANYREIWEMPIEVPYFDIGSEHGGLDIVKRGGGMQTKSLRMEAEDGKQYVLRSIEKFPENAIPKALRKTFAGSIVKDQISASHPYGAFVVPYLAEAAKIYHTNPKVVYIPDDPKLGEYREDFANTLALYEERPQGKAKDQDFFGNADKIVNTFKVIEKLKKDNDNYVDQPFVLRNRLFDMLIGDWDRHDDQWRWARFDGDKGDMYRPIPRDRDQAFFVNQGFLPKIISRKWALPKIEGFDDEVDWAPGLMFNARYFDRSFLSSLSRETWIEVARSLKEDISDQEIEDAIGHWPKEIYEKNGKSIIQSLKKRRDNLEASALEHYAFLAKEVDVVGSDKNEHFQVNRLENGDVEVLVEKINKKGERTKKLYHRVFKKKETNEIRLYGRDGKDEFDIDGKAKKSIRVRIISGRGKDKVVDQSRVSGLSKKTKVYDRVKNTTVEKSSETKLKLGTTAEVHAYDRKSFRYNTLMPLVDLKYNKDDGVFLGGGFLYTKHGWRKQPFESKHKLIGNRAFGTNSFNINYNGTFTDALGNWDLDLLIDIQEPRFVGNYFGLGNETVFDTENRSIDYHRVRFENNTYQVGISNNIGAKGKFSIGVLHKGIEIKENDQETFISEQKVLGRLPDNIADLEFHYTGVNTGLTFDTRDHPRLTKSGLLWKSSFQYLKGWQTHTTDLARLSSSFSTFFRVRLPSVFVIANRVGVSHNFNNVQDLEFFNASTLGGIDNLRSYRRTRFYGNTSFYHNLDIRTKLLSFRTYLFPGELGILGFHDVGRVWLDGENSDEWHTSAGVGIWIAPVKELVVSFSYGFTNEENLPFLRFGFFF